MQISIVAFDKFTDIDVSLPWYLLNRARTAGARDWKVKNSGKTPHVTSVAGLTIPTLGRSKKPQQFRRSLWQRRWR